MIMPIALIDLSKDHSHGPSQIAVEKKRRYFTVEEANRRCRWSA